MKLLSILYSSSPPLKIMILKFSIIKSLIISYDMLVFLFLSYRK